MDISITFSEDKLRILALYFQIADGAVHKTIEVAEGQCYVDVDADGKALGVEMLAPKQLKIFAREVAGRFNLPELISAVSQLQDMVAA